MCSERNTPWMTGSDVVIDGGKFNHTADDAGKQLT
jgi:hypothetical protein